ncbi:MAG TPA: glycosyltransferase [Thermoanaerobaculia bacterium]|nr:glycosyltransferase [Thermoanaerobaculia bacterium]
MRILLVTSRYPWPPRRGDQLRAAQMVELLSADHEVTLLAPAPAAGQGPPPPGARVEIYEMDRGVALAGGLARAAGRGLPLQSGLFHQRDLTRRLRQLAPRADLAVLQLVRLAIHLDDFDDFPELPLVVDLIDSLSLNLERRAAFDRRALRPLLRLEARRIERAERRLAGRARRTLVVCERDRQHLASRLPPELAGRLAVVGLAVAAVAPAAGVSSGSGGGPLLALTGNLGYFVNSDAVRWFLRAVWPELRIRRPDVRLLVAGDRPAAGLRRAIAGAGASLVDAAFDLRPLIAAATIALAPLRGGSGVPIKVLEAWSGGVPVVASPWAAAGTSARAGDDLRIADRPREWLDTLLELLASPAERQRLAANGLRRLAADYSAAHVRAQLLGAFESARTCP